MPLVDVPQLSAMPDGAGRRKTQVDVPADYHGLSTDTAGEEGEGRESSRC